LTLILPTPTGPAFALPGCAVDVFRAQTISQGLVGHYGEAGNMPSSLADLRHYIALLEREVDADLQCRP
jgi:hypothetical protein